MPTQTALINKWGQAPVDRVYRDTDNSAVVLIEATLPGNSGPGFVREALVRLADGSVYALIKHALIQKTIPASGQVTELTLTLAVTVSTEASITVVVNASDFAKKSEVAALRAEAGVTLIDYDGAVLAPGGTYLVDSSAAARTVNLPAINLADRRRITVLRRGANPVVVHRATAEQTIEGAADDLRINRDFKAAVLIPAAASAWLLLNRGK